MQSRIRNKLRKLILPIILQLSGVIVVLSAIVFHFSAVTIARRSIEAGELDRMSVIKFTVLNAAFLFVVLLGCVVLLRFFVWKMRLARKESSLMKDNLREERILVESIKTLSENKNFDWSINRFLSVIGDYYKADRTYLFHINHKNNTLSNTYEWCSEGVEPKIREYRSLNANILEFWIDAIKREKTIAVSRNDKTMHFGGRELRLLDYKKVDSIMAVPFIEEGVVVGYLGLDNPEEYYNDFFLLESVSSFVYDALQKKNYTDRLMDLSFKDNMTGTKNRHAYFEDMRKLSESSARNVGIVFCDINGLKTANDQYGHEAGDALINESVVLLTEKFNRDDDEIYRIGGDEFVVCRKNISEEDFYETVQLFIEALEESPIMSIGEVWIDQCNDIESQIKVADEMMYQRKEKFYKKTGKDRRR